MVKNENGKISWSIGYTLIFFIIIFYVAIAAQEPYQVSDPENQSDQIHNLLIKNLFYFTALLFYIGLILIKRKSLLDYLNLYVPKYKTLAVWLGIMIAFKVIFHVSFGNSLNHVFGSEIRMEIGLYFLKVFTMVVSASIFEEVSYNGFLFKTFEERRLVWIGILLPICFRILTHQQGIQNLISVIVGGLLIGLSRWKTKNTMIPIAMHAMHNFIYAERFTIDF